MSNPLERRKDKRIPFVQEVECEGSSLGKFHTRISDLSTAGAFIDALQVSPAGTIVNLKFRVGSTEIRVEAEVRYSMPQIGMGVRFLNLSSSDRLEIAKALQEY